MQIQININEEFVENYLVYEGQTAEEIAQELAQKHSLDHYAKAKIEEGIRIQLESVKGEKLL